jgi:hypothetical protein
VERRSVVPLLALLAYAGLSAAIFGRQALPDIHNVVEGFGQAPPFYGHDQSFYAWTMDWAARALTHGQNLFLTTEVFAPSGYNLAWSASMFGPGVLFVPVTLLVGAIASFNILVLAAPATAAWTAFLLCREITARPVPAFAGGLLFGFGTYESVEMINHLSLALIALLPLAALLVLRRQTGKSTRVRFMLALGFVLALQLWTATEVFASLVLFGGVAFVLAALLSEPAARRRLGSTALETLGALAGALVLASPLLYYAFNYPNAVGQLNMANAGADLANFVIPNQVTWLYFGTAKIRGNLSEQLAYVGVPMILLLGAFAVEFRRDRLGRFLLAFMLVAFVASLGAHVYLGDASSGIQLPWSWIGQLPLLRFAEPVRFVVYLWLAIAVAISSWLARPSRPALRRVTLAVVVATLIPNLTGVPWGTRVDSPQLMRSAELARYVPPGATVLALPFGISGDSMFWQLESNFRFKLAGGYVSVALPAPYEAYRGIIITLNGGSLPAHARAKLCGFLELTRAQVILLREGTRASLSRVLAKLGIRPERAGGFSIYELGRPSQLAARCARLRR